MSIEQLNSARLITMFYRAGLKVLVTEVTYIRKVNIGS